MSQTANFRSAVLRERKAAEDDFIDDMRSPLEARLFRGTVIGPFDCAPDGKTLTPCHGEIRLGKINPDGNISVLVLTRPQLEGSLNLLEKKPFRGADPLGQYRSNIIRQTPTQIVLKEKLKAIHPGADPVYIVGDYTNFSDMLLGGPLETAGEVVNKQPGATPKSLAVEQLDKGLLGNDPAMLSAAAAALSSANDFLSVKGPPGTGKTWLLARIALKIADSGKTVTLTGPSHAAVNNALREIADVRRAFPSFDHITLGKASGSMQDLQDFEEIENFGKLKGQEKRDAIDECNILGLTLNSLVGSFKVRDEWKRDVLIVDEAGQMLMMQIAAASGHYKRALFFGDEAQLAPVKKASHNPHTGEGDSCMQYLIRQRGDDWVFPLTLTHRLNASICSTIQQHFYPKIELTAASHHDSRLKLSKTTQLLTDGINFIDVPHEHACTRSEKELDAAYKLIEALLQNGELQLATEGDNARKITPADFAILAPFRNQVSGLQAKLKPLGIDASQIGTVDKMQGQGRPIILYSCTSSSADVLAEQAEFIFSPNRWNVLLSRAMAQCYILGSREQLLKAPSQTLQGLRQSKQIVRMLKTLPEKKAPNKRKRHILRQPEARKPETRISIASRPITVPKQTYQLIANIRRSEVLKHTINDTNELKWLDLHYKLCRRYESDRGMVLPPPQLIEIYDTADYRLYLCDPDSNDPRTPPRVFQLNARGKNSKTPKFIKEYPPKNSTSSQASKGSAPTQVQSTPATVKSAPTALLTKPTVSDPAITIDSTKLNVKWQAIGATGHTHQSITLRRSQWQRVCTWLETGSQKLIISDSKGKRLLDGFPDSKALRYEGSYWRAECGMTLKQEIERIL